VNCLACQKTFGKTTVIITTVQNPYWGGGPWKRHQDSPTHIAAMEAQNSNKQLSLMVPIKGLQIQLQMWEERKKQQIFVGGSWFLSPTGNTN
jgi:hypothetical protein